MAWEIPNLDFTLLAAGDYSGQDVNDVAYQYRWMRCNSDGEAQLALGDDADNVIGILQNDPEADQAAGIRAEGISKIRVEDDQAIVAGDYVSTSTNDNGLAIRVERGVAAVQYHGIALEGVDALEDSLGQVITVLIKPGTLPAT